MQVKKEFLIWGLFGFVMICIISFVLNLPIGVRHVMNLAFPPKDLYEPILIDKFPFNKESFSKEYEIKPKYIDYYEFGFIDKGGAIPSTYKFGGVMKLTIEYNKRIIFEKEVSKMESAVYNDNDMLFLKKVVLATFKVPSINTGGDMVLKIKNVKRDDEINSFIDGIKLYVAVSSTP